MKNSPFGELLFMGFSKNRNTSEISYMTNISYKATNRSNT